MICSKKCEQTKPPMIAFSNTCANPRTVMIVHFNASPAAAAMETAWWFYNMTGPAHI